MKRQRFPKTTAAAAFIFVALFSFDAIQNHRKFQNDMSQALACSSTTSVTSADEALAYAKRIASKDEAIATAYRTPSRIAGHTDGTERSVWTITRRDHPEHYAVNYDVSTSKRVRRGKASLTFQYAILPNGCHFRYGSDFQSYAGQSFE